MGRIPVALDTEVTTKGREAPQGMLLAMLIMARRVGERIMIGDTITVAVMALQGGQVKIGIEAPKDVSIDREEIYLLKQAERQKPKRIKPG
jgi:carbon storage regulator